MGCKVILDTGKHAINTFYSYLTNATPYRVTFNKVPSHLLLCVVFWDNAKAYFVLFTNLFCNHFFILYE